MCMKSVGRGSDENGKRFNQDKWCLGQDLNLGHQITKESYPVGCGIQLHIVEEMRRASEVHF